MAYVYQVSFKIEGDQMGQLQIGSSLERTLGYLKTLLPNQEGFISARALRSVNTEGPIHLIIESAWETWSDFLNHQESSLLEQKILIEFRPHLQLENLTTEVYDDVA